MLRILLGLILFWVILRFVRILIASFSAVRKAPPPPEGPQRGRVRRQESLKAEDAIDVDYTESTQSNQSKSSKEPK